MELGVMQGRLTEKGGFYPQVFPWLGWEDEFYLAEKFGVTHIEWMLNADRLPDNPIMSKRGREKIAELEMETGVQVRSLCLNFVMQYSLQKKDTIATVTRCLCQAAELENLRVAVIPLEGASSPAFCPDDALGEALHYLKTSDVGIKCSIESSYIAEDQMILLEKCNDKVGICYDVGNAAGMGRDVLAELRRLSGHIDEIHLKDKRICDVNEEMSNGGQKSTYFGDGIVDFQSIFRWLKNSNYHGNMVLESYFDSAVDDLQRNLSYLRSILHE